MKIYIRNMVCNRCKMVVKSELERLGFHPVSVELGEVSLEEELSETDKAVINSRFVSLGFELIDNRKSRIIERVKNLIVDLVHTKNCSLKTNLSDMLVSDILLDYSHLSSLFSEVEDTTIEQFYIRQKIERVKELIVYDELTLNEIADLLHYSSTSYLGNQFKRVTGLTPSHYKQLKARKRIPLEDL